MLQTEGYYCDLCKQEWVTTEEHQRVAREVQRLREALGEVYDAWIEDADPQECEDLHEQVRAALEGQE